MRTLTLLHRWLGVPCAPLFALWFARFVDGLVPATRRYRWPLVLTAVAVMGCGAGSVTGQVKLNGVRLAGGWVTLNYTNGKHAPVSGSIQPDGTYRIAGCPSGEARVTISVATRSLPLKKSGPVTCCMRRKVPVPGVAVLSRKEKAAAPRARSMTGAVELGAWLP